MWRLHSGYGADRRLHPSDLLIHRQEVEAVPALDQLVVLYPEHGHAVEVDGIATRRPAKRMSDVVANHVAESGAGITLDHCALDVDPEIPKRRLERSEQTLEPLPTRIGSPARPWATASGCIKRSMADSFLSFQTSLNHRRATASGVMRVPLSLQRKCCARIVNGEGSGSKLFPPMDNGAKLPASARGGMRAGHGEAETLTRSSAEPWRIWELTGTLRRFTFICQGKPMARGWH